MAQQVNKIESVFDALGVLEKLLGLNIKVRKQTSRIMESTPPDSPVHKEAKRGIKSLEKLVLLIQKDIKEGISSRELEPHKPVQGLKINFKLSEQ